MRKLIVFVFAVAFLGSCVESDSNESISLTVYEDDFTGQSIFKSSEESNSITVDQDGLIYYESKLFNGKESGYYPKPKVTDAERNDNGPNLEYEGSYKDGIKEGSWKRWYENGNLHIEEHYKEGKYEGLNRAWYNNGQLSHETNYKGGERHGLVKSWYENGQLKEQGIYKNGKAEGLLREWHENGQLLREANLKEDYPDGLYRSWHENGNLSEEINFNSHKMNGLHRTWHTNGYLMVKGNYKEGSIDGIWEYYNEERQLIKIVNYKLGEPIETKTYKSLYENTNVKLKGPGFIQFNRYFVHSKSGFKLKQDPNLNSRSLADITNGKEVFLISKTGLNVKLNDSVEEPGNIRSNKAEWLKIEVEIELKPGDDGYYFDHVEGASTKMIEGYLMDGFLEIKIDSIKKSGVWSSYYETGEIKKEEFCFDNRVIKSITYFTDGNISEIVEYRNDYFWEGSVRNTFHKNGEIKSFSDAESGGAVSISFDENGEYVGDWDYSGMKDHFDKLVLSKNIKEFYLPENKKIDLDLINN